jgi:predicted hydrocarbon binding protein/predicted amino acid-binding ACT domain protein
MTEKVVMVMRRDPKKRYFLISAMLKEQVGALADMTKILAIRGVNILEGHIYVTSEPHGYVTLFAEATDAKADADFLKQMLKGSSFLESVTVLESRKGMIVDTVNFPLMTDFGQRSILLSAESVRDLFRTAKEGYGNTASEAIYSLGFSQGGVISSKLFVGLEKEKETLQEFLSFYGAVGMGKPIIEKYSAEAETLRVSVEGCFECEGLQSSSPVSTFFLGVLAGSFTTLFGKDVSVKETKCVAMGAKKCEFEIGPSASRVSASP